MDIKSIAALATEKRYKVVGILKNVREEIDEIRVIKRK